MQQTLDLIRHGEPVGGRLYRGNGIDDPLSDAGWEQMWAAVAERGQGWERIITSPMLRCRAFAEALGEERGLPVTIEPRFRELGFGDWEGLAHAVVRETRAGEYLAFRRDPVNATPPGAEPLAEFARRSRQALHELLDRPGRCLVVTHAGVIRSLVGEVMEMPLPAIFRLKVEYAQITQLRFDEGRGTLLSHSK